MTSTQVARGQQDFPVHCLRTHQGKITEHTASHIRYLYARLLVCVHNCIHVIKSVSRRFIYSFVCFNFTVRLRCLILELLELINYSTRCTFGGRGGPGISLEELAVIDPNRSRRFRRFISYVAYVSFSLVIK